MLAALTVALMILAFAVTGCGGKSTSADPSRSAVPSQREALEPSEVATLMPPPTTRTETGTSVGASMDPALTAPAPEPPTAKPEKQSEGMSGLRIARAKKVIRAKCSKCHAPDPAFSFKGPREQVQGLVDDMNVRGAGLTESEAKLLVDYLSR